MYQEHGSSESQTESQICQPTETRDRRFTKGILLFSISKHTKIVYILQVNFE